MSSISSATTTEHRWLDYAWSVVNCTPAHRGAREAAGGARPGPGRELGNELRWPGYLGRNYVERRDVLCIGHSLVDPQTFRKAAELMKMNGEAVTEDS